MSTAEEIIEHQGWNRDTQLDLAMEYIENQDETAGWLDFLNTKADAENQEYSIEDVPTAASNEDPSEKTAQEERTPAEQMLPELRQLIPQLTARGIRCYVLPHPPQRTIAWMIIERDGNVGTIEYQGFEGYQVSFSIKPSRQTGSALHVGDTDERIDESTVIDLAEIAVGEQLTNFATKGRALPNQGWPRFSWCRDCLVEVTP